MNMLSINIRGLGVDKKAAWIKEIKFKEKVSFLAFQETNRSDISDDVIARFWGNSVWAKEVVDPVGRRNPLYLGPRVKGCMEEVNILTVYAPQSSVGKRALWSRILSEKSGRNGLWIVLGDFNDVRYAKERKNSRVKPRCARDFNGFIHDVDLCDLNLKGSKFTFMLDGVNGKKFSKIDRVMLRHLRNKIKEWRDGLRNKEVAQEEMAKSELEELEEAMEDRDLLEEEGWICLECKKKLLEMENHKAKDLRQRSRVRWASDGDDNSKFFHGFIKKRKATNTIPGLLING
ncbi:uncharacterized protein LOC110893049 [Helianthus annuus]|uniref:uncharacterized protein LOC110893049 n=1 Tax=Helianthus annuus TaxID=4232 RepID=UPI000B906359|nr:uncharacterized protein LOC110893049 [Helianthus annuus]